MTCCKGTTILTSVPFAHVLLSTTRSTRCDYCFSSTQDLHRCSACKLLYFCGKTCQKKSWRYHKKECDGLLKVSPKVPPDFIMLMARVLIRLKTDGYEFYEDVKSVRRQFKDLVSHSEDIKKNARKCEHLISVIKVLQEYLGKKYLPSYPELLEIYGKLCVNTFNILDGEMEAVGCGLYLAGSFLDHSCNPDGVVVFDGTTLYVRLIKDLPHYSDDTPVFISYIDLCNDTASRRRKLLETYFFDCNCTRCCEERPADVVFSCRCTKADCDGAVMAAEGCLSPCQSCGCSEYTQTDYDMYTQLKIYSKQKIQEVENTKCLETCIECLEEQESLFHRLNLYRNQMLLEAFDSAIEAKKFVNALVYGLKALEGCKLYAGETSPIYGCLLLKLAKLHLYLNDIVEARDAVMKAKDILEITHGRNHSFYVSTVVPLIDECNLAAKLQYRV